MDTTKIKHIGASGDDNHEMNAALVKAAKAKAIKLSGISKGYEGLIDVDLVPLKSNELKKAIQKEGIIRKTTRSSHFIELEGRKKALKTLKIRNIDPLIAMGADCTLKGLLAFRRYVTSLFIGIPGTIDNYISDTDYTLGFNLGGVGIPAKEIIIIGIERPMRVLSKTKIVTNT